MVVAVLMFCEACGMRVRVARDDPQTFCRFVASHRLPTVDAVVLADGRRVDVVTV